jgi:hypothetical protein
VSDQPSQRVGPCSRCGQPAERPVVGWRLGREDEDLPLCVDCFQLLLEDVKRFWDGMGDRGQG